VKILFSSNDLIEHFWEKIKTLSVSLLILSTLPISHQPGFGSIEHWFELFSSCSFHLGEVSNCFTNESFEITCITLPAHFNIIWVDLNFKEESSLGSCVKILVLEILLNLGPHICEDATLWEESKSIITCEHLHVDYTFWLFEEAILLVPDVDSWLS